MTDRPHADIDVVDDDEVLGRVRLAVERAEPFSLVRLGDGEGVVLAVPEQASLQDLTYLHGHWGAEGVGVEDVIDVRRDMEDALATADVVGVRADVVGALVPDDLLDMPGGQLARVVRESFGLRDEERTSISSAGARRLALLHHALDRIDWRPGTIFASAWLHWEMLASGLLAELLTSLPQVGLVTSRPELGPRLAQHFDIDVAVVDVPDKHVDAPVAGAHVPSRYREMREALAFDAGTTVLVGAGIPAKAYCSWLKQSGCVALDVGSVLDAWVGRASRPRVLESRFGVAGGRRVPPQLQLGRRPTDPDRGLTPRWKPSELTA